MIINGKVEEIISEVNGKENIVLERNRESKQKRGLEKLVMRKRKKILNGKKREGWREKTS